MSFHDMAGQRVAGFVGHGNMGTVMDFADALNLRRRLMDTMQQTPELIENVLEKESTVYAMTIILNYIFKAFFVALLTPEHMHHADFIKQVPFCLLKMQHLATSPCSTAISKTNLVFFSPWQVLHSMLWLGYAAITRDKYGRLICVPPTEYTVLSRQEYKNVFENNRYSGLSWRKPFEAYRCIFASDRVKKSYSFTGFGPPIVIVSPFNRPPIAGVPCAPICMFDWISRLIIMFYNSTMTLYLRSARSEAYTPTGSIPTMSAFVKAAGATQMSSTHTAISQKFAEMTQVSMDTVNRTARKHLTSIDERLPTVDDMIKTNVTPVDSTHIAFAPVVAPTEARMTPVDRMDDVVLNAYGISPSWVNLGHSSDRSAHINLAECTARYVRQASMQNVRLTTLS
jgi:hypothetical protein